MTKTRVTDPARICICVTVRENGSKYARTPVTANAEKLNRRPKLTRCLIQVSVNFLAWIMHRLGSIKPDKFF